MKFQKHFFQTLASLIWLAPFLCATGSIGAELKFTPEHPSIKAGERITLSVSGLDPDETITWLTTDGRIEGAGTQVTYVAAKLPYHESVFVQGKAEDGSGYARKTIEFAVLPNYSAENATWIIDNNRYFITHFAYDPDSDSLWVATRGGLELRQAGSGEISAIFTEKDGLPSLNINALELDKTGNLWVATADGLAKRTRTGRWEEFTSENSGLPGNGIRTLHVDEHNTLWVGTGTGLARAQLNEGVVLFQTGHSGLPVKPVNRIISHKKGIVFVLLWDGSIYTTQDGGLHWGGYANEGSGVEDILIDREDNIWMSLWAKDETTEQGYVEAVARYNVNTGKIDQYYTHKFSVNSSYVDSQNNLWLATQGGGVSYLDVATGISEVFSMADTGVPIGYTTAIVEDKHGAIWVGTGDTRMVAWQTYGLMRRSADGHWERMSKPSIPDNLVSDIMDDGEGGLWVSTLRDGARRTKDGEWKTFELDPEYFFGINNMHLDNKGGLWAATYGNGLFYRTPQGEMKHFTTENSNLPSDFVELYADSSGQLWIITDDKGFAKLLPDATLQVFNTRNSQIPADHGIRLADDGRGGLWIGTNRWYKTDAALNYEKDEEGNLVMLEGKGIVHLRADGTWGEAFNTGNSPLPHNNITSLHDDGEGGVWIGTHDGLAHYKPDGQWEVIRGYHLNLPGNHISALYPDKFGGLWVGTARWFEQDAKGNTILDEAGRAVMSSRPGLAYLDAEGRWAIFDRNNSGLPDVAAITKIHPDGDGGLWIGTHGAGLVHLGFGNIEKLMRKTGDRSLGSQRRAAIIIAAGGSQGDNSLWDATEASMNYVYRMLNERGFLNEEIYYLSSKSWADFDNNGSNDNIVDGPMPERPLAADDIHQAFEWAVERGVLDQPLFVFFMDHGGDGKVQLAPLVHFDALVLDRLLDNYQVATGNSVVVMLEACHSGSFLQPLAAPKRAVIASARSDEKATFLDKNTGFLRFFTEDLLQGMSFRDAFSAAVNTHSLKLKGTNEPQHPEFDDNGDGRYDSRDGQFLSQTYVNGRFVELDATLAVQPVDSSLAIQAGQSVTLKARADTIVGTVKSVWALIKVPKVAHILNASGTPVLGYPRIDLQQTADPQVWEATWTGGVYSGQYEVIFYAEDNNHNLAMSENTLLFTVLGGNPPPDQARIQIQIERDRYRVGETAHVQMHQQLGYGYDLYAAVVLPKQAGYLAFQNEQDYLRNLPKKWTANRSETEAITFNLPLIDLPVGDYKVCAILSPEKEDVLQALALGLSIMECEDFMLAQQ